MQRRGKDTIFISDYDKRKSLRNDKVENSDVVEMEKFQSILMNMGFKVTKTAEEADDFEVYILTSRDN